MSDLTRANRYTAEEVVRLAETMSEELNQMAYEDGLRVGREQGYERGFTDGHTSAHEELRGDVYADGAHSTRAIDFTFI